jgi:acyl carrier protein
MPNIPPHPSAPSCPAPDPASVEGRLLGLIAKNLFELPPGFDLDTNLYHAGLDSMALMHLLILIENHFGLMLAEADISRENFASIRSLSALIAERTPAPGKK